MKTKFLFHYYKKNIKAFFLYMNRVIKVEKKENVRIKRVKNRGGEEEFAF